MLNRRSGNTCEESDPILWTSSPTAPKPQTAPPNNRSSSSLNTKKTKPIVVEISDSDEDEDLSKTTAQRTSVDTQDIETGRNRKAGARIALPPPVITLDVDDDDDLVIFVPEKPKAVAGSGKETEELVQRLVNVGRIGKQGSKNEKLRKKRDWFFNSDDDNLDWTSLSRATSVPMLPTTNFESTAVMPEELPTGSQNFSATTIAVLADLKRDRNSEIIDTDEEDGVQNHIPKKRKIPRPTRSKHTTNTPSSPPVHSGSSSESKPLPLPKPKRTTTKKPVDPEVAAAKEALKVAKESERAEKAAEKARKAAEKEAAAAQKRAEAELTSLNKLKRSKTETVKELIVDMSTTIDNSQLALALVPLLEDFGCDYNMNYRPPTWITNDKIVKWRRKVKKYWDPGSAMFRALPTSEVRDEEHILIHLTGLEFMQLAIPDMSRLDRHVESVRKILSSSNHVQRVKPIYIIEGLRQLIQRCVNTSNRHFRAAVTAQIGISGSTASSSRRYPQESPAYTQDAAELALLQLQFHHCLVRETVAPPDSAEWIALFTSNISAIPYKVVEASKGGDTFLGNVKTGANPEETFVRMLQEISRVTIPAASGIVGRTGCIKGLVEMLDERGVDALSDVRTRQTRSGAPSERKVGNAISRRIAGIFMGTDPGIDDV